MGSIPHLMFFIFTFVAKLLSETEEARLASRSAHNVPCWDRNTSESAVAIDCQSSDGTLGVRHGESTTASRDDTPWLEYERVRERASRRRRGATRLP